MQVSSEAMKRFLLELVRQGSFPGHMSEFITAAKAEIASAAVLVAPSALPIMPPAEGEQPCLTPKP